MAVNSMSFNQSATLLNEVVSQMNGAKTIAPVDESEFVRVATTALQAGYDQLGSAISQVIERSVYGARVYSSPFPSLVRSAEEWGGITRKFTNIDLDYQDSPAYDASAMETGKSVDPFEINRRITLQFNFYGGQVEDLIVTYTREQLKTAFSGSGEFGSFMLMTAQDLANQITQRVEAQSREALTNLIASDLVHDDDRVIHALTEYKKATGNATITAENYLSEQEFDHFAKWLFATLKTTIRFMRNRSGKYHTNLTTYNGKTISKKIQRFTPADDLNVYMNSGFMAQVESSVLSATFHDDLVGAGNYEAVDFWQSIDAPTEIDVTPNVLKEDGTCEAHLESVKKSGVLGLLFDTNTCGVTVKNESVESIYNPRGKYLNEFHTTIVRSFNDQTENSVVIVLD